MPVNRGAMLDLMIRLAQTPMPDGQTLVDREAVAEYLPEEVKSSLLRRMKNNNQQLAQLQQMIEQLGQQLQQLAQENQKNDQQTMQVVEEITASIEQLNKQILQLQDEHDRLEEEKKKEEETNKIKTDSYNSGYADAEKIYQSEQEDASAVPMMGQDAEKESVDGEYSGQLPEEILQGLEGLSDDELALIMEQNPEVLDLIK
jgi:predicted nuclease with TOPRIM domain